MFYEVVKRSPYLLRDKWAFLFAIMIPSPVSNEPVYVYLIETSCCCRIYIFFYLVNYINNKFSVEDEHQDIIVQHPPLDQVGP